MKKNQKLNINFFHFHLQYSFAVSPLVIKKQMAQQYYNRAWNMRWIIIKTFFLVKVDSSWD